MPTSTTRRTRHERSALEAHAQRILIERRRQLAAALGEAQRGARSLYETQEPDWEDRAANTSAASGLERIGEAERAELLRVTAALQRLDEGTWGSCVACKRAIGAARLRAAPEAIRCARCAEPAIGA